MKFSERMPSESGKCFLCSNKMGWISKMSVEHIVKDTNTYEHIMGGGEAKKLNADFFYLREMAAFVTNCCPCPSRSFNFDDLLARKCVVSN